MYKKYAINRITTGIRPIANGAYTIKMVLQNIEDGSGRTSKDRKAKPEVE